MKKLKITVEGQSYEVTVEVLEDSSSYALPTRAAVAPLATASVAPATIQRAASAPVQLAAGAGDVASPMSGNVFKVEVQVGAQVNKGDKLIILEAMKMETPIFAPGAGKVEAVLVKPGDTVHEGQALVKLV